MIRELAGYDVDRYDVIARWPLAEALIAFEHCLQQHELEQFRHEQSLFAAGRLKKAPTVPPLLKSTSEN